MSDQFQVLSSIKIASFGNVDNTPVSNGRPMGNVATIPHNMGYIPLFLVYKSNGQGVGTYYSRLPFYSQSFATITNNPGKFDYVIEAQADTQNLYIDILSGLDSTYSGLLAFRYFIFSQPNS